MHDSGRITSYLEIISLHTVVTPRESCQLETVDATLIYSIEPANTFDKD
jgi:hypothetical protein